ncbi:MAG: glutaminyl-peptide cyclotransferase [Gemmatimonadetes bacterium]|nr:glutaminyl-peptide cyclotransferase [Gemmatimonadota bacterium]MYC72023.1 glutaminyl-peptide cyclotransferase [Gemmatimonadota bacterium]MYI62601.1 glutaminyl-peptide cyclotransferase [Gemmatimonadota bacterium]
MIRKIQPTAIALLLATHASCQAPSDDDAKPAVFQPQKPAEIPTYSYRVICAFPHDPTAFTQGLLYNDGFLYESTGQYGQSSLRKVELKTGAVLQLHQLDDRFFAEGLALFGNRLLQLTWRSNKGFAYRLDSFEPLAEFTYPTEGWGLTYDGELLVMSDGSSTLYFRDPFTFAEVSRITVAAHDKPVSQLNELEWIADEVFANIWQTDTIARINPATGQVSGWIDLTGLLSDADRRGSNAEVLNGIAYDPEGERLFVTGKWWPKLYQIELISPSPKGTP